MKKSFQSVWNKLVAFWKQGKLQRGSRIAYDVIWNIVLFFIIVGLVGLFLAFGVGAGYFASLVDDQEVLSYEDIQENIYSYSESSEVYFDNDEILGTIRSDLHREEVTLDNIAVNLKNAIIATEDEYFHEHEGVVPKAIMRAVYQEAVNADTKTGGSTLTQQLIKNQILTDEVSFERKAKEILLAIRLEKDFTKEEIFEAYLNIVPFGRNASGENIAGIQTAAQGIFGVDASDLSLPQAAFIAGLPQSPSYYTPFTNSGELKEQEALEPGLNRMRIVLDRMVDSEYITQEEYEEAINYDIIADFKESAPSPNEEYPYLVTEMEERAKKILREQLAEADGYTVEDLENNADLYEEYELLADQDLRNTGYKIHTTINKDIFERFQDVAINYNNYGPDTVTTFENSEGEMIEVEQSVQTGGVLIENETGKILSFLGGRDYEDSQVNFATDSRRQNGSTMKPLLVYAPAMEMGIIQPATVVADVDITIQQAGSPDWSPQNYGDTLHGLTTIREALIHSYNIPAVKVFTEIMDEDPASTYLDKMGFSNMMQNQSTFPAAALGGVGTGPTVEENTNAFATFGNNGNFVEAYMIERIETNDGELLYEHESEEENVFSEETNYLMLDMMRDVLSDGTARTAQSALSNKDVDWAGKTGTTNDDKDVWFVATNPTVTMGTWMGYPIGDELDNGSSRNQGLWAQLINAAEEVAPEIVAPDNNFSRPEGIVEAEYCQVSGMAPSSVCNDIGLVDTDIFHEDHVPDETDNSLERRNGQFVFNEDWLEENEYDELENMSQLTTGKSGDWDKIVGPGTDNSLNSANEEDNDTEEEDEENEEE